jgi:riboflavin kinase/FMN adenylyltransferase
MRILTAISELSSLRGPIHLAVGVFDGVHLGHRAVIMRALEGAGASGGSAVVLTFDPHPASVLRPGQNPRLLASLRHKARLISALGIEHLLVLTFDADFAAVAASAFIEDLVRAARPLAQICVGEDWRFGKGRVGNAELLETLGRKYGFALAAVPAVKTPTGEIVSSTRVREAIQQGDLDHASLLLGHEYTVLGEVIEGRRLGRSLGFPTANLRVFNEELPPNGVYAIRAARDGRLHAGVGNLGLRPTLEDATERRLLEVHLFDFGESIYGEELEVHFVRHLRPERKFENLEALKEQIGRDAEEARRWLGLSETG